MCHRLGAWRVSTARATIHPHSSTHSQPVLAFVRSLYQQYQPFSFIFSLERRLHAVHLELLHPDALVVLWCHVPKVLHTSGPELS